MQELPLASRPAAFMPHVGKVLGSHSRGGGWEVRLPNLTLPVASHLQKPRFLAKVCYYCAFFNYFLRFALSIKLMPSRERRKRRGEGGRGQKDSIGDKGRFTKATSDVESLINKDETSKRVSERQETGEWRCITMIE